MDYSLYYSQTSNHDISIKARYFLKLTDYTELLKYIISVNNNCLKYRRENGLESKFNIFVDLEKAALKNADYDFMKILIPFLEEGYPNTIIKMYFLNIPFIFKTAYTLLRVFIGKETKQKIVFIDNKKKNELSEEMFNDLF
tara:strand:+ start:468 stop:890 length:423 start_codon:yes stop_codon:yes gene_type:complete